jgi:hypothetical protein
VSRGNAKLVDLTIDFIRALRSRVRPREFQVIIDAGGSTRGARRQEQAKHRSRAGFGGEMHWALERPLRLVDAVVAAGLLLGSKADVMAGRRYHARQGPSAIEQDLDVSDPQ